MSEKLAGYGRMEKKEYL